MGGARGSPPARSRLDGAADGKPFNLDAISSIAAALTIPVQVGGGVRHIETAQELVNAGIDRVVIGTAAVTEPEFVQRLCERYGLSGWWWQWMQ